MTRFFRMLLWPLLLAGVVFAWIIVQPQDPTYHPILADNADSLTQIAALTLDRGALDSVAFSDDGEHGLLASAGADGTIRFWDVTDGNVLGGLAGHEVRVSQVTFSPDGTLLASGGQDTTVRLWDIASGSQLRVVTDHTSGITALAFRADGRVLASGASNGQVVLTDVTTGAQLASFSNYGGPVRDLAFSPNGSVLAAGGEDGTIWLVGLTGDTFLASLRGHTGPVTAVHFTRDGGSLLSTSWDGTARLWDVVGQSVRVTMAAGDSPIMDAALTSDETVVVTASLDGQVRLFDSATGVRFLERPGFGSPLSAISVNNAGTLFATAGTDGVLGLWAATRPSGAGLEVAVVPTSTPEVGTGGPIVGQIAPATILPPTPTRIPTRVPLVEAGSSPAVVAVAPTLPPASPTRLPITEVASAATPNVPSQSAGPSATGPTLRLPTVNTWSSIRTFPLGGGSWEIDPWEPLVGHLQGTSWITENSNIVLGGHSRLPDGRPGIFAGLYGLNVGDPIILEDGVGLNRQFTVVEKRVVAFTDLSVIYQTDAPRLTLITCDLPSYDPNAQFYWERLVVIAVPMG
jgi:LPXTG-site transpeptidase (sortase) family protein